MTAPAVDDLDIDDERVRAAARIVGGRATSSAAPRCRERRVARAEGTVGGPGEPVGGLVTGAGREGGSLPAGPTLADRIAAAEAAAARLEGEIQHLRDTLGHVDELVSATNRLRRVRTLVALLQREKRAAEARAERRDVQFEAAAERARAA